MYEFDPDLYLTQLKQCRHLPESAMKRLCQVVKSILIEESNVQPVSSPVTVCGDIHGQLWDLLELLRVAGDPPATSYIFMVGSLVLSRFGASLTATRFGTQGDFVDRGYYSLETLSLLLTLKAKLVRFTAAVWRHYMDEPTETIRATQVSRKDNAPAR